MPVTSRVCFVRFNEQESVGVSQHLTNTVFVDRALIVVPYAEGWYLPGVRPQVSHGFSLADCLHSVQTLGCFPPRSIVKSLHKCLKLT